MKHLDERIRVPIESDNPSILRVESRCIKCGNCAKVCKDFCAVLSEYKLNDTKRAVCVNCGQCLLSCPVNSIVSRSKVEDLKQQIKAGKTVIVSTSPACRVSLGEEFGLKPGALVEAKMIGLLKQLGFRYVLDTNFGADLTIVEEAYEFISRTSDGRLPMFSSCCPSWVKYVEIFYPEQIKNLSSCRSPIAMQGTLVKTYFAKKYNIDPKDIVSVCLTPCVAKKMEINRPEQCASGVMNGSHMMDNDYCLTVKEVAEWAIEEGIEFSGIKDRKFDSLMSSASGSGAIFGKTGGVTEAIVKTILEIDSPKQKYNINFKEDNQNPAIKTIEFVFRTKKYRFASVYGLKNARTLLNRIENGEHFDFVEVMACPGGCVGGGGQPKTASYEPSINLGRLEGINIKQKLTKIKTPLSNPEIKKVYKEFLLYPNSYLCKKLLHTNYLNRSGIIHKKSKIDKSLFKCEICGNVFEVVRGDMPICDVCGQKNSGITQINN